MNVEFDWEKSSQAEIDSHIADLTRQRVALEEDLQSQEDQTEQIRAIWQQLRQETLNRLDKLVTMMSPDSSEQTLEKLARIFPNEPLFARYLQMRRPEYLENPENISAQMFGNSAGSHREIKATLSEVLLKSTHIPREAVEFGSFFQFFLNGKTEFYVQDGLLIQRQIQLNQISQQLNAVCERLEKGKSESEVKI